MGWIIIIVGLVLLGFAVYQMMFVRDAGASNALTKGDMVRDKLNPNMTRFAARSELKPARAQAELITELNNVGAGIVESINKETEAILADERRMNANYTYLLEQEKMEADHRAYLELAENQVATARMASQYGTTPDVVAQVILLKAQIEAQESAKDREMQRDIERKRQEKEIEFEFESKVAQLDAKMAEMQHLLPQHLINALDSQLSSIHMEYEQVKLLDEGDYKQREIKRVDRKMKALEKTIRERQKDF
jgi:hypothetical protein